MSFARKQWKTCLLLLLLALPTRADNVTYILTETLSAPQFGAGSYSLEVTAPGFIGDLPESKLGGPFSGGFGVVTFQNFNSVTEPSVGDCNINMFFVSSERDGSNDLLAMNVTFKPLCQGLFDAQVFGFDVPHDTFGTFIESGPQYDYDPGPQFSDLVGTVTTTLTIEDGSLPVTTPEPATLSMLIAALVSLMLYKRLSSVPKEN